MRILLTGASGRFGTAFRKVVDRHEVVAATREQLARPGPELRRLRPDWVVHAAAWTDVDACEAAPADAMEANGAVTGRLALAAREAGARVAYLSTDYVFDGRTGGYREDDATGPVNVYGASKLDGERRLRAALPEAVVARTSVVFGTSGKPDFVSWVAAKVRSGERFPLVAEQRASPTSTPDLARQVLALLESDASGTFHTAGRDALTRLEMASCIAGLLGQECRADPVPFAKAPWKAPRPRDSSLDVSKVSPLVRPMAFRDAAAAYLQALEG